MASQDDGHTGQVVDLGAADDEGVDVEATSSKNTRYARKDAGFVRYETIEDVALRRSRRRQRRLVENVRDGGLGSPGGRFGNGEGAGAKAEGLVGEGGSRRGR